MSFWLQALPAVLQGMASKKMMLSTAQSPALSEDEAGATARLSEAVRVRFLRVRSGPHAVDGMLQCQVASMAGADSSMQPASEPRGADMMSAACLWSRHDGVAGAWQVP